MKMPDYVPEQVISGALHYFRIHPGLWDDRLDKAVAMGLNTVETYLPWNLHERRQGEFDFSGICDVELFIRKTAEHGLKLILRPGPYICSEWDNGGLPGWLCALPGVRVRCMNRPYLDAVEKYFAELFPRLLPYQATKGGPVIMFQLENEYGSFGNDHEYMQYLQQLYERLGVEVPCFTSDGPYGQCPIGGGVPGVLLTGNFGMNNDKAFASLRSLRPDEPDFCMEFWDGWFDHWGKPHQHRPAADGGEAFDAEFEAIIKRKANINLYMFHGGTNFGFTAGAGGCEFTDYSPIVTSYDYDCPLSECGDPTDKYILSQQILQKYTGNPQIKPVPESKKIQPSPVTLTEAAPLRENLANLAVKQGCAAVPPTLEELGESFGFVFYRTRLDRLANDCTVRLHGVHDYAQLWADEEYLGSACRFIKSGTPIRLEAAKAPATLELLVESLGHINYGIFTGRDPKGITGAVALGQQQLFHWEYFALPLDDISKLNYSPLSKTDTPATFYRGTFEVDDIGEAFIRCPGTKGCIWVNGFNLGRYWEIGPTETLYLPSTVLKKGKNEIVVFEQEKLFSNQLFFSAGHELGELAL